MTAVVPHLALALALAAPVPKGQPWPLPPEVGRRKTDDPLVRLLQQDRLDEAAHDHNGQNPPSPDWLYRVAEKAAADGRAADALCLYEAYLRHFPLGYRTDDLADAGMPGTRLPRPEEWRKVVGAYLALRARTEKPDAEWFKQSREAAATYDKLREEYRRGDAAACLKLADEILEKYPKSLFAEPAVLTFCYGPPLLGPGRDVIRIPVKSHLDKMDRAGVPPAGRVQVLLFYQNREYRDAGSAGRKPDLLATPAEVAKLTKSLPVRQHVLRQAVIDRLVAKDLPASREYGRQLLATYPAVLSDKARREFLTTLFTWTDAPQVPDEAEWWVREWQRGKEWFYEGDALTSVAGRHEAAGRTDRAVALYEEAAKVDAELAGGRARWSLAAIHRKRGDEAKMLALLKELAEPRPAPGGGPAGAAVHPAGPFHEMAKEAMGDHYMEKKDWKEALKWWEAWRGQSGCGLGIRAAEQKKQRMIETCQRMLGAAKP